MESIKLNIGGGRFDTTRKTLLKSPFFASFLRDGITEYFIDRNPKKFEPILEYLRNASHDDIDEKEAEFYGIKPESYTPNFLRNIKKKLSPNDADRETKYEVIEFLLIQGIVPIPQKWWSKICILSFLSELNQLEEFWNWNFSQVDEPLKYIQEIATKKKIQVIPIKEVSKWYIFRIDALKKLTPKKIDSTRIIFTEKMITDCIWEISLENLSLIIY